LAKDNHEKKWKQLIKEKLFKLYAIFLFITLSHAKAVNICMSFINDIQLNSEITTSYTYMLHQIYITYINIKYINESSSHWSLLAIRSVLFVGGMRSVLLVVQEWIKHYLMMNRKL
jgi:hypothetical protein